MAKTFEIYDFTTSEVLADNLIFDDVPELFKAYQDFYPNHAIDIFYYEVDIDIKISIKTNNMTIKKQRQQFKAEWFKLLEENLCNAY